jgi:hypothetical protein
VVRWVIVLLITNDKSSVAMRTSVRYKLRLSTHKPDGERSEE